MTALHPDELHPVVSIDSIGQIHGQMAANPHYPFNLRSGWLPAPDSPAMRAFLEEILTAEPAPYPPSVQALADLITGDPVLSHLMDGACRENGIIAASDLAAAEAVNFPRIATRQALLDAFNAILTRPPAFIDDELVGLPFSAVVVGIDPTPSGMTLFRLPMFNEKMAAILDAWHQFLGSDASSSVFSVDGEQWLSPAAKQQYQFEVWERDSETLPYWKSWNSFFTRRFKDQAASRPVAHPDDDAVVASANDGSLFRWDDDLAATDVFWFKDMSYSLSDILSSSDPAQQQVLDGHGLVDLFTGGSIFQTYLNPYNFHRWWCPVSGTVVFDPVTVPGCYFDKLVIPDFGGATTASLPYLVQVNARGILVIETEGYGYVGCVPLGMSEVSTITFDPAMKAGASVTKGQEMGMFEYGGSSYVLLFQQRPGKRLIFQSSGGDVYEKHPVLPKGSAGSGGNITLIGSQIGKWEDVDLTVSATLGWQAAGHVNPGERYSIRYLGGLWTANPALDGGNLYGPTGSGVEATQPGYALRGAPEGALVGRVGTNPPFPIGSGTVTPAGQTGPLLLTINDDLSGRYGEGLRDNTGQITVSITPAG